MQKMLVKVIDLVNYKFEKADSLVNSSSHDVVLQKEKNS